MSICSHAGEAALFALAFACTTPAPAPSRATTTTSSFCGAVPGLTEDASTDRTGHDTDQTRVLTVKNAHEWEVLRCPGVNGVGMTVSAFVEGIPAGWDGGTIRADEKTWVIKVYLRDGERLPRTNPLYLEGVRVHFVVAGEIVPL